MGSETLGLGFEVSGLVFEVSDLVFKVLGLAFNVFGAGPCFLKTPKTHLSNHIDCSSFVAVAGGGPLSKPRLKTG